MVQAMRNTASSDSPHRKLNYGLMASILSSHSESVAFIPSASQWVFRNNSITGQAFGRGNGKEVKESISVSLISFLVISIILAIIGYTFSPSILRALNTPLNIDKDADIYLRIYFLGLPFLFMYNILSSIFNALGKSRIPLFLLIFSSLLNIILDIVAVTVLEMGVAGAAWATLISQAISAMLSFCILLRKMRKIEGRIERYFSFGILSEMSGIALPSILQQSVISFGMMLVQSVVNTFGSEVPRRLFSCYQGRQSVHGLDRCNRQCALFVYSSERRSW